MTMRLSPLFCNWTHFLIAPINERRVVFVYAFSLSTEIVADVWNTRRLNARENAPWEHLKGDELCF